MKYLLLILMLFSSASMFGQARLEDPADPSNRNYICDEDNKLTFEEKQQVKQLVCKFNVFNKDFIAKLDFNQFKNLKSLTIRPETKEPGLYHFIKVNIRLHNLNNLNYLQDLTLISVHLGNAYGIGKLAKSLKRLDVSYNSIENLRGIQKLYFLEELNISYNLLSDLNGIEELAELRYLDVSGNLIKNPGEITKCGKLETLIAKNCELASLQELAPPASPGEAPLKNLKVLDVSTNEIEELTPVSSFGNLRQLYINDNLLITLEGLANPQLRIIEANNNRISSVAGLLNANLNNLAVLRLRRNYIIDTGELFYYLNLKELDLGSNQLTNFTIPPYSEFAERLGGARLETLKLNNNYLREIPEEICDYYETLLYFYIFENQEIWLSKNSCLLGPAMSRFNFENEKDITIYDPELESNEKEDQSIRDRFQGWVKDLFHSRIEIPK
ncbi:MAG: hypothetical protein JXA66_08665 [Oligoflexia bacterium]|nr:hypothetical protein [Oligoflexia bacterium]